MVSELMLFYVEKGVNFTNDFGDIDEGFYSSLETTYEVVLTLMKKESLPGKFADRTAKVVADTIDIGWHFHDNLFEMHSNFYATFSDDKHQES